MLYRDEAKKSNFNSDVQNRMLQEREMKIVELEHLLASTQEEKEMLKSANKSVYNSGGIMLFL